MTAFRVVQFNMQFGQGWAADEPHDGPVDLSATLAEIRRHQADIILLQEVEQAQVGGAQLQPPPNYTQLCAGLSEYHGAFAYPKADARELPFGLGLAMFSRQPLHEQSRLELPSPPIEFEFRGKVTTPTDRLLLSAKTRVHGREIRLLNTHLLAFFMLGTDSRAYPLQRDLVARELDGASGPTILAGDFNVRDHADLSAQFAVHGFRPVQAETATWRRQPYVLDHIYYNEPLKRVSHEVVPTLTSDHHVVVADFEFA